VIPLAIQAAEAAAAYADFLATRRLRQAPPRRGANTLDSYAALWLQGLADAGEPLCIGDLLSRHGTAGASKSHLTRGIAALVERGHAEFVRRGAKGRRYYVITPAGREALAANTPRHQ
jgi:hypothetical protein